MAKLLPQNTICEFALSFGSSPALGCSHSHSKLLAGADIDDVDDYDDDDFDNQDLILIMMSFCSISDPYCSHSCSKLQIQNVTNWMAFCNSEMHIPHGLKGGEGEI